MTNPPPVTVIRHLGNSPMANAARMNVAAITSAGLSIRDMAFRAADGKHDLVYHHANPGELDTDYQAHKRIAYWTWEVGNYVPDDWKLDAKSFDQIWVPSLFVKGALERAGVRNVRVIPCFASYGPLKPIIPEGLRFLAISSGRPAMGRENPWGVIDAFRMAFPRSEPARLTVKAIGLRDCDRVEFYKRCEKDTRITLLEGHLDEAETMALMSSHTALVSLHRSISFGAVMLSAMSVGLPVIATLAGGNTEFCSPDVCLPVFSRRVVATNRGYAGGEWHEPDTEDAANQMRYLRDNLTGFPVRGMIHAAYERTMKRYNFMSTVTAIKQAINEL